MQPKHLIEAKERHRQFKPLQDYGWKKRNDICPGQHVWFKQSCCNRCLQALVKSVEVS